MSENSVLVVEDDTELGQLLVDYLKRDGFHVALATDGRSGLERAQSGVYQLIILDIMLPELDGFEVLKALRKTSNVPVIVLTARTEDVDRITGLDLGADDYVPKPFNPKELAARVRAVLRRAKPAEVPPGGKGSRSYGPLTIDLDGYEARLDGAVLEFTAIEFALLRELALVAGRVLSRELLLERVRNREFDVFDRSIDVHISHIRQKLGDDAKEPKWIKTVRGVGYVFLKEANS